MKDKAETLDDLLQYYHSLATVTLNRYMQVYRINPIDVRLLILGATYNRYACLFNLYIDLRRRRNETRKPPF